VKLLKVIIVDDDDDHILMLQQHLLMADPGIKIVATAENITDAYSAILAFRPDLVFLDIEMPNGNGIELAKRLRINRISVKIVIISGKQDYAIEAIKVSVFDYLVKPYNPEELKTILNKTKLDDSLINLSRQRTILFSSFFEKLSFDADALTSYYIQPDEVIYIKVLDLKHIQFYVTWQDEPITVHGTVTDIRRRLPYVIFAKIAFRTFINMKYLSKISNESHKCFLNYKGRLIALQGQDNYLHMLKQMISKKKEKTKNNEFDI